MLPPISRRALLGQAAAVSLLGSAGSSESAQPQPRVPVVDTHLHCFAGRSDKRFPYHERAPYRPDEALSDLLAILDDRIESEGVQVGLPDGFLHQMWGLCNDASAQVSERMWLEMNSSDQPPSKARVRELTYRALLAVIETSS